MSGVNQTSDDKEILRKLVSTRPTNLDTSPFGPYSEFRIQNKPALPQDPMMAAVLGHNVSLPKPLPLKKIAKPLALHKGEYMFGAQRPTQLPTFAQIPTAQPPTPPLEPKPFKGSPTGYENPLAIVPGILPEFSLASLSPTHRLEEVRPITPEGMFTNSSLYHQQYLGEKSPDQKMSAFDKIGAFDKKVRGFDCFGFPPLYPKVEPSRSLVLQAIQSLNKEQLDVLMMNVIQGQTI